MFSKQTKNKELMRAYNNTFKDDKNALLYIDDFCRAGFDSVEKVKDAWNYWCNGWDDTDEIAVAGVYYASGKFSTVDRIKLAYKFYKEYFLYNPVPINLACKLVDIPNILNDEAIMFARDLLKKFGEKDSDIDKVVEITLAYQKSKMFETDIYTDDLVSLAIAGLRDLNKLKICYKFRKKIVFYSDEEHIKRIVELLNRYDELQKKEQFEDAIRWIGKVDEKIHITKEMWDERWKEKVSNKDVAVKRLGHGQLSEPKDSWSGILDHLKWRKIGDKEMAVLQEFIGWARILNLSKDITVDGCKNGGGKNWPTNPIVARFLLAKPKDAKHDGTSNSKVREIYSQMERLKIEPAWKNDYSGKIPEASAKAATEWLEKLKEGRNNTLRPNWWTSGMCMSAYFGDNYINRHKTYNEILDAMKNVPTPGEDDE